jgi:hypothetical protein
MPAPQISKKLLGGRQGRAHYSPKGTTELDPGKLDQISLNRDAIQALTIAQAKVQVTISAGGTTAVLVSEETGKQIGGIDDLSKLLALRSFVAKEKKLSASSDLQEEIITSAYRVHKHLVDTDPTFVQKKLDNTFVLAAKPYKTMSETMQSRHEPIAFNYNDGSSEYVPVLKTYCMGINRAIQLTLAEMVKGEKEKGKMEAFLFDEGVPAYVRNKLLMKSLAITKDTDLSRVLFPQDPSKGLSLTIKEWRDKAFVRKQGWLMRNSGSIIKILQNDELVLELTGLTAEQFSNAEDPRVQRVLKTRILVVPPFEDFDRVLEPLSRANFRGFGLPNTAMDQSKDRLANLCAVPIRAYAFSVRMAETITDFYDRILPAGTIKPADDKLGNYAKQALSSIKAGTSISLLGILQLTEKSTALMQWIERECKIIPNGALSKKIASILGIPAKDSEEGVSLPTNFPKPGKNLVDVHSSVTSGAEKDAIGIFRKEALSFKDKTIKGTKRSTASSVLKREARTFLKFVAKEHSPSLAISMEAYFRGFYSEDIQSAAVRIAEARFDELDDLSEIGSSEEETSDDEDDA